MLCVGGRALAKAAKEGKGVDANGAHPVAKIYSSHSLGFCSYAWHAARMPGLKGALHMDWDFILALLPFVAAGFAAQLIDGAWGWHSE